MFLSHWFATAPGLYPGIQPRQSSQLAPGCEEETTILSPSHFKSKLLEFLENKLLQSEHPLANHAFLGSGMTLPKLLAKEKNSQNHKTV